MPNSVCTSMASMTLLQPDRVGLISRTFQYAMMVCRIVENKNELFAEMYCLEYPEESLLQPLLEHPSVHVLVVIGVRRFLISFVKHPRGKRGWRRRLSPAFSPQYSSCPHLCAYRALGIFAGCIHRPSPRRQSHAHLSASPLSYHCFVAYSLPPFATPFTRRPRPAVFLVADLSPPGCAPPPPQSSSPVAPPLPPPPTVVLTH